VLGKKISTCPNRDYAFFSALKSLSPPLSLSLFLVTSCSISTLAYPNCLGLKGYVVVDDDVVGDILKVSVMLVS
jgi:hypothetical protein